MKIAFATCVQLGKSCLEKIYDMNGKIELLITLKDEIARGKSGRIYVDNIAKKENIEVIKIKNINEKKVIDSLKSYKIDWLFIIGWSQIAKKELLEAPKYGCIGMHPTLLPEGRGRAAIPWAIIKGLNKTGVTLFKIDEGVDTGDIIAQEVIELNDKIDSTKLYSKVNKAHINLIENNWKKIINNEIIYREQDETKATYWDRRIEADGEIMDSMTIKEADRLVRATTKPYPGAFIRTNGKVLRIWKAKVSSKHGKFKLRNGYLTPTDYEWEN